MRVAIIGYSGSGRTTLATALAGVMGMRPIHDLDDLWVPLSGTGALVLDGIPSTLDELEQIEAKSPEGSGIDHAFYLQASAEIRLRRIARAVVAGSDPASPRNRMLRPVDLKLVRDRLDVAGRLTVLDATRTRTDVLADALDLLGIAI
jgi:adenylate kinase family enzyme